MNTIEMLRREKNRVVEKDYNGRPRLEYFINENDNYDGKFIEYVYRRNERIEKNFVDGVEDKTYLVFDIPYNLLKRKITKIDDKHKNVKKFYNTGVLSEDYEMKHIRNKYYRHGLYKSYHDNGKLRKDCKYSMGKYIHEYKEYDGLGNLVSIKNFKRGGKLEGKKYDYQFENAKNTKTSIKEVYKNDIKIHFSYFSHKNDNNLDSTLPSREELKSYLKDFNVKLKDNEDTFLVEDESRNNFAKYIIGDISLVVLKDADTEKYSYEYYYLSNLFLKVKKTKGFYYF